MAGCLTSFGWGAGRIDLVILDARDLSEVALVELLLAVPHGLHGSCCSILTPVFSRIWSQPWAWHRWVALCGSASLQRNERDIEG